MHLHVNRGIVVNDTLQTHEFRAVEKWLQEVCWRRYWKGWLEMRPSVWSSYRDETTAMFAELDSQRMRLTQYFSDRPTRQSETSAQQAEDGFVALNKWCPTGFRGAACKKTDGKVSD